MSCPLTKSQTCCFDLTLAALDLPLVVVSQDLALGPGLVVLDFDPDQVCLDLLVGTC